MRSSLKRDGQICLLVRRGPIIVSDWRVLADGHPSHYDDSRDDEGYFYFSGRSDDIILSAGYRIGPFEVENVLMTHPSVAECAVVGVPDELRGESIKAYIVLRSTHAADDQLAAELREWVRQRLAKTAYPREIAFVATLPKTPSGKIQRYQLRHE